MQVMADKDFDRLNKNEKRKELCRLDLAFFPALVEDTVLVQRDWLSWSVLHRPHPEDRVCWTYAYTGSV